MAEASPFEIHRFGGWKPGADPQEIGWTAATDMLNVDLEDDGRLTVRDGMLEVDDAGWAQFGMYEYPQDASNTYMVSFKRGTTLELVYTTPGGTATSAGSAWGTNGPYPWSAPVIGTTTSTLMFVTSAQNDGTSIEQLKKWSGPSGSFGSSSVTTKPLYAAVMPNSNRLALAHFGAAADSPSGADGSTSTVFFSDANTPETFGANNFVHLTPGDGEKIAGMVAYRDFLIVFKETKFFVFYGESIGPDGSTPEFNYRTVKMPSGRIASFGTSGRPLAAAGPDGVYFATSTGVYRTDGGLPVEVSGDIEYMFRILSGWAHGLFAVDNRLYMVASYIAAGDSVSQTYMLVYDIPGDYWLKWDVTSSSFYEVGAWYTDLTGPAKVAVHLESDSRLLYMRRVSTDDDGTAIAASYTTGRQQMSPPGSEGVVREVLLDGTGTVTCNLNVDGTDQTSGSVTPTAASIGRYRKAARGRTFQLKLSSTSGSWALSRVVANVRPGRPVGAS